MKEWPKAPIPGWLTDVSVESMQEAPFPLADILRGSLYYPASAFDGAVIKHLAKRVHSFIHVDYSITREQLTDELVLDGFWGYRMLGRRAVTECELVPGGWRPRPLEPGDGDPRCARRHGDPFCDWAVCERLPEFRDEHGPARFSLLHLNADGAAAFDALYRSNGFAPSALAIVQPGTGFGGNWTDFRNPSKILGRLVLGNPAGVPEWLLFGGEGCRDSYRNPCWPSHAHFAGFLSHTDIGVWRRTS